MRGRGTNEVKKKAIQYEYLEHVENICHSLAIWAQEESRDRLSLILKIGAKARFTSLSISAPWT